MTATKKRVELPTVKKKDFRATKQFKALARAVEDYRTTQEWFAAHPADGEIRRLFVKDHAAHYQIQSAAIEAGVLKMKSTDDALASYYNKCDWLYLVGLPIDKNRAHQMAIDNLGPKYRSEYISVLQSGLEQLTDDGAPRAVLDIVESVIEERIGDWIKYVKENIPRRPREKYYSFEQAIQAIIDLVDEVNKKEKK
jgi:hypothetical protein